MSYAKILRTPKVNRQLEQAKSDQIKNNAGGYVFGVSDQVLLERFLISGTVGGTYYVDEKKLTNEFVATLTTILNNDGVKFVDTVVDVSVSGRAPKNDHALFALALASSVAVSPDVRKYALSKLNDVARTGTHLFQFISFLEIYRKLGGASVRKAIARWYNDKSVEKQAYQMLKYQNRENKSHKDMLALSHQKPVDAAQDALFKYVVKGYKEVGENIVNLPQIINDFEKLKTENDENIVAQVIRENNSITREMVPTKFLNNPKVMKELIFNMPLTALVRTLGPASSYGLMEDKAVVGHILKKLGDADYIKQSRLHPISILTAYKTYSSGRGLKGNLEWSPYPSIVAALDSAFYMAFDNIEPSNSNFLLGCDVSGSMSAKVSGINNISCVEASAVMAMATLKREPFCRVMAFSNTFVELSINASMSLSETIGIMSGMPFSSTDCALPMLYATKNNMKIDTFVVYTDSETYYGDIHPFQALQQYRKKSGIKAKLIVVAMTSSRFSIADPSDPLSFDICGFDTATPSVISNFSRIGG